MKYADMHCDTLTELYRNGYTANSSPLHISLDRAEELRPYVQVAAVWTDKELTDDEGYERFLDVVSRFRKDPAVCSGRVRLCGSKEELDRTEEDGGASFVLAVEGARLLGGDMERLDALGEAGVRLITLQWSGADCIGGAWDTSEPLTDFGKRLLREMAKRGIAADISHASVETAEGVLDIAEDIGLAVCASHSNSAAVWGHRRNLDDRLFRRVAKLGGIVGLSMAPEHLTGRERADISDICRHLNRYLDLGGEDIVCFGCDFDGITSTPDGVGGIGDIPRLREALAAEGVPERVLSKLFFENARRFIRRILV